MSCKYHPEVNNSGDCVDCGVHYCDECRVHIVRHGNICLDCGAKFARKKIMMSILFAIAGGAIGFTDPNEPIFRALTGSYILWASYFGYHYGGFWAKLGNFVGDSMVMTVLFLSLRMFASIVLGTFGGGIVQFMNYLKIIKKRGRLQGKTASQSQTDSQTQGT